MEKYSGMVWRALIGMMLRAGVVGTIFKYLNLWHDLCLDCAYELRPFCIHLQNFQFSKCRHLGKPKNARSLDEHTVSLHPQVKINKSYHGNNSAISSNT